MKKHKLKIRGTIADLGGGTWRYEFVISPLVPDSPVFSTYRYILEEDRHKENRDNNRGVIAKDLRAKHRAAWERYHRWAEAQ